MLTTKTLGNMCTLDFQTYIDIGNFDCIVLCVSGSTYTKESHTTDTNTQTKPNQTKTTPTQDKTKQHNTTQDKTPIKKLHVTYPNSCTVYN